MLSLFGKGKDWIKAPISGSTILVCYAGAIVSTYLEDIHGMLLWMILAEVIGARRDKYLEEDND